MSSYVPFLVTLTGRTNVSASFLRITLHGVALHLVSPTLLDQRVKLVLAPDDDLREMVNSDDWFAGWREVAATGRGTMRTYTVAARRPEAHEVDIDIVVHGENPGVASTWASTAPLGSLAVLVAASSERDGHEVDGVAWRPGGALDLVVVADETALVAAQQITEAMPAEATGRVVVEVPHASDVRQFVAPAGVRVHWAVRERGERAHALLPFPVATLREEDDSEALLWSEGEGRDSYLWVAGEAAWVRAIRTAARDAGITREASAFMGYWRLGHAEM